jgi:hypothetical protein
VVLPAVCSMGLGGLLSAAALACGSGQSLRQLLLRPLLRLRLRLRLRLLRLVRAA